MINTRCWLEVDLETISRNLGKLRQGRTCAVVKADAYHLGAKAVGQFLERGVEYFAVATADEALELYEAVGKPILILNFPDKNLDEIIRKQIRFTVFDSWQLEVLESFPGAIVHLKFDSGMNRLGFRRVADLADCFGKNFFVEGVYTHIFSEDPVCIRYQFDRFAEAVAVCRARQPVLAHVGGSGIARGQFNNSDDFPFDMLRLGIDIYRGAVKFKSHIISVKEIRQGDYISYGDRISECDRTLGILSCGYADGVPRGLSDRFSVRVKGLMCPIVGRICMDMMLVDITFTGAQAGDEALVFDGFGHAADLLGTIDYELMTGVSNRAERVYI